MGFLRRLLGGDGEPVADTTPPGDPADPGEVEAAERAYEHALLNGEQERLDELQRRQLRYAEYAWTPPPQGGERRADDEDRERQPEP